MTVALLFAESTPSCPLTELGAELLDAPEAVLAGEVRDVGERELHLAAVVEEQPLEGELGDVEDHLGHRAHAAHRELHRDGVVLHRAHDHLCT